MLVICLEGCHGVGKTELCKVFEARGFTVLDEAFLDQPDMTLHPQSLLMETTWVCHWFMRLLKHKARIATGGPTVFIADRSPFSAVFYAKRRGSLLEPLIREHVSELAEEADIHCVTVHVDVDRQLLWDRIQARLAREPHRAKYNEGDPAWMDAARAFYQGFQWDHCVMNNDGAIGFVADEVLDCLRGKYGTWIDRATPRAGAAARAAAAAGASDDEDDEGGKDDISVESADAAVEAAAAAAARPSVRLPRSQSLGCAAEVAPAAGAEEDDEADVATTPPLPKWATEAGASASARPKASRPGDPLDLATPFASPAADLTDCVRSGRSKSRIPSLMADRKVAEAAGHVPTSRVLQV